MNLKIAIALMALIPGVSLLSHQESKEKSVRDLREDERTIKDGTLDLSQKGLTSLDGLGEIEGIETVTQLYLNNNLLVSLPSGTLSNLANLKTLDISCNFLSLVPEEFDDLRQLEALSLSNNFLSKLPEMNLPQLKELKVDGNSLEVFPLALLNLANLNQIILSGNRQLQNEAAMLELINYRRMWHQHCPLVQRSPQQVL